MGRRDERKTKEEMNTVEVEVGGKKITLETGRLAKQANGAVLVRCGDTVVLVEQNVAQSLALAHRGYILENGRIVLDGTGAALRANDAVRQAYVGI